jgi:hypothetical protein
VRFSPSFPAVSRVVRGGHPGEIRTAGALLPQIPTEGGRMEEDGTKQSKTKTYACSPPPFLDSALDVGTTSCRFYIFDQWADVIANHQIEFEQRTSSSSCVVAVKVWEKTPSTDDLFPSLFALSIHLYQPVQLLARHFYNFTTHLYPSRTSKRHFPLPLFALLFLPFRRPSVRFHSSSSPRARLARTRTVHLHPRNRQVHRVVLAAVRGEGPQEGGVEGSRDCDSA